MAYVLTVVVCHRWYLAPRFRSPQLSLAVAIAMVQCGFIATILGFSFSLKIIRQIRAARAEQVAPRIREILALQAGGTDCADELRRLCIKNSREVEQGLVEFLRMVRGGGRELLSDLAADLHLVKKWCGEYQSRNTGRRKNAVAKLALVSRRLTREILNNALFDRDETVRLHTARAMISNLDPAELGQLFGLALTSPVLTRMVLAEDLRPYALDMVETAIPAVLTSGASAPLLLAALEILRAWGKFLPLPEVYSLLHHSVPAVRAAALDILPLVPRASQLNEEIEEALNDPAEEVRASAAKAAGMMGISQAVPVLARCLREGYSQLAEAAAAALAQLGPEGTRVLESETISGPPLAASVALQALERDRIRSTDLVVA
jgi:HEAT repeat protein